MLFVIMIILWSDSYLGKEMYIAIESGVERVLETKKIYNKFGFQVFCMQNYIRLIKSNDGFYLFIYFLF